MIFTWYRWLWVWGVTVATIAITATGSDSPLDDFLDRLKPHVNSQTMSDETLELVYDMFREIESIEGIAPPKVLPESKMTTVELITNMGYKAEKHNVTTEDGYTIEIHRILPFGKKPANRFPVLLQHGVMTTSSNWVLNFPNQSLGFMLASAGFDVWLSNIRGSRYGKIHKHLQPDSKEFWSFGLEETSTIDLPAMIDYVLQATNSTQVQYVGHSMGTTMAFILLSTKPQYNDKIRMFMSLAPIVYLHHSKSKIVRLLVDFIPGIKTLLSLMKIYALPPTDTYIPTLDLVCRPSGGLCMEAINDCTGSDPYQLNNTRFSVYIHQMSQMTSMRIMIHYTQILESKLFRPYDWGIIRNLFKYRQLSPPPYPLESITTPTVLYIGSNDHLSTPEDVRLLIPRLPHNVASIVASDPFWDHADQVWGMNAGPIVYDDIIQRLRNDSINS